MHPHIKRIYDSSPHFVQNILLTLYSTKLELERYGEGFSFYSDLLSKSQWFSENEIIEYQNRELKNIIRHAYDTVPYYRKVFEKRKLVPDDIKSKNDLIKIPILNKQGIKNNYSDLKSKSKNLKNIKEGHTSGTTGSPLTISYDASVIHITYAALKRQYDWAGAALKRSGDRIAVARGNVIVPLSQKNPPFWRYNYFHNQLLLSSFHLSNENLRLYFDELKKFSPKIIDGYPSTLYILAKYLKNHNLQFPVHAVITSSETLYDFQRKMIEESFQCKIFDYYALAERVIFATECEFHQGHHLCPEYGIHEILDTDGLPLEDGSEGRLIGTSLHNYGMPLIRYVTDDMTAVKTKKCGCGRSLPLIEDVTTKAEDILTLKDGRMISSSTLTHPFKPMTSVDGSQIIQEAYDLIRIKLVPNRHYKASDADHLISEFQSRLGEDVTIKIEYIEKLPKLKSGKFRWVISNVKLGI